MKGTIKRRAKSEGELLDHATNNLLRAIKRDMLKKDGRVDKVGQVCLVVPESEARAYIRQNRA